METSGEMAGHVVPLKEAAGEARRQVRIWCLVMLAITLPIIAVAIYLKPDPSGLGSHTQLGLPACGWYQATGYPCMTCGCTTAVTHILHGHLWSGFVTQPFGAVFGIATVMTALLALTGVATGKWYGPEPFWMTWHWRGITYAIVLLVLGAWWYKVAFVATAHG